MAFTVTALYTAQALTAESQTSKVYAKADLNAFAFNGVTIELKLTNGVVPPVAGRQVQVYYVFSSQNLDISTADVAGILRTSAYTTAVATRNVASAVVGSVSIPVPLTARYLYAWVTHDNLGQPITLDASYIGYNFGAPAA